MQLAVLQETFPGERRVAVVPASVKTLGKLGCNVLIESGAGAAAGYSDAAYTEAGARVITSRDEIFREADVLVQVRAGAANPVEGAADLKRLREEQTLIAQCEPLSDPQAMVKLAESGAAVFSLELLPRITRAQSMDVLSSMATLAGYKAVLLAADALPQMFPMMMTAAGTMTPARVFVIGAGVAGLQAIATARRLGAVVEAYDVRPAAREQVESLGARFVEMELAAGEGAGGYAREMGEEFYRKQRELMHKVVAGCDVVITTAAIPGRKSPVLITAEMVRDMPAGSVIVDLAAERGGNCELTQAGQTIVAECQAAGTGGTSGVTILGPLNLPSDLPRQASLMYSNNVVAFLKPMLKAGQLVIDPRDEVVSGTLVAKGGELVHPVVRQLAGLPEWTPPVPPVPPPPEDPFKPIKLVGDEDVEETSSTL